MKMQLDIFSEDYITEGEVYELDGVLYRCIKILGDEKPVWFQQLNADGSEYKVWDRNHIHVTYGGERLIWYRLREMKKVDNFPNEKTKNCQ